MPFCDRCGEALDAADIFCSQCGADQIPEATPLISRPAEIPAVVDLIPAPRERDEAKPMVGTSSREAIALSADADGQARSTNKSGVPAPAFDDRIREIISAITVEATATSAGAAKLLAQFESGSRIILDGTLTTSREAIQTVTRTAYGDDMSLREDPLVIAPWSDARWLAYTARRPALRSPALARIGTLKPNLESFRSDGLNGVSLEDLDRDVGFIRMPALVPILGAGHLMIQASGPGLERANEALCSLVVRLIAGLPPGKVRLSLIDPIGRGKAFAPLLGFHEIVKGAAVWDDPGEISEELGRIKAHISNVVQRYLRNEFENIEQYNRRAGDVAEPYRVVVIARFPAEMSVPIANDVLRIATTGVRTGVHLLMSVDTTRTRSLRDFSMTDIERLSTVIAAQDETFTWRGRTLLQNVELDSVPPKTTVDAVADVVNPAAARSDEVQISLEECLGNEATWVANTLEGIAVPVGVTGAREPLVFELAGGATVSPHALVGGKSGFGKSNLLHALVLGLCHRYSPTELHVFLIDMKEGVEFAPYRMVPHVRVLAIESDREFAVNVLDGLRQELERRGELFREYGSDFKAYREKNRAKVPLPRLVLIVDEFQILFHRSDRWKTEARILLSDLTRRGRSFGIHVVLASQTLLNVDFDQGALSQIGVRVALQLDEHDSHIVLGKDNDAARYLTRRGEAIYNNRNGLLQHNRKFQVAYLDETAKANRLDALETLGRTDERALSLRPRVFEGNRPATVAANGKFGQPLQGSDDEVRLYFGEPVSLAEDHVGYSFVAQRRSHLVVVGQHEPSAVAVVLSACASALGDARVELWLINAARVGSDVARRMASCKSLSPAVTVGGRTEAVDYVGQVYERMRTRTERNAHTPLIFVIFGIHHLDGDFPRSAVGLSKEAMTPQKMLAELVRKGPDVGVHLLVWSSTYQSVVNVFDRDLAEFDGRVALQGGDAINIIPDVRLREHVDVKSNYGVIFDQELRTAPVKFRCYGDIDDWIVRRSAGRTGTSENVDKGETA